MHTRVGMTTPRLFAEPRTLRSVLGPGAYEKVEATLRQIYPIYSTEQAYDYVRRVEMSPLEDHIIPKGMSHQEFLQLVREDTALQAKIEAQRKKAYEQIKYVPPPIPTATRTLRSVVGSPLIGDTVRNIQSMDPYMSEQSMSGDATRYMFSRATQAGIEVGTREDLYRLLVDDPEIKAAIQQRRSHGSTLTEWLGEGGYEELRDYLKIMASDVEWRREALLKIKKDRDISWFIIYAIYNLGFETDGHEEIIKKMIMYDEGKIEQYAFSLFGM